MKSATRSSAHTPQVVSPVTPNKNGSAFELGESKTDDTAILHDPVEIVTGTVTWRPERAETAFTVHIPLPMRALFVLDVRGATTGFEGLSGAIVIDEISCCQGGCDVRCRHRIAVSNGEVLERLDHFPSETLVIVVIRLQQDLHHVT